jgi:hypothetical protein
MGIHDSLHCSFLDYVPHACAKVMPFADVPLASAFVARWCVGTKVETAGGVFQVREDELAPRIGRGRTGRRMGSKTVWRLPVSLQKRTPAREITPGSKSRRSQMGECRIAILSEHRA